MMDNQPVADSRTRNGLKNFIQKYAHTETICHLKNFHRLGALDLQSERKVASPKLYKEQFLYVVGVILLFYHSTRNWTRGKKGKKLETEPRNVYRHRNFN